ncbi:MAG TPA: hypothetical protein VD929_04310 [Caulobacteraceae bacterium]|nr:hypothetical protein [Caulobacteraceae bacterium]
MRKILFSNDPPPAGSGAGAGGTTPPAPPAPPAPAPVTPPTTAQLEARLAAAEKRLADMTTGDPDRAKLLERIDVLEKAVAASKSDTPKPPGFWRRFFDAMDFTR